MVSAEQDLSRLWHISKSGMSIHKIHSIETNIVSKLPTSNDKARMKHPCSTALTALGAIITIVKGAARHAERRGFADGNKRLAVYYWCLLRCALINFVLDAMLTDM